MFNTKLKKYEGKYVREVPLFPEVAAELEKLRAIPGNEDREFVINRYPNREKCNLGTQFDRISERAGLGKIPRPFDNMRASRSTEIYAEFGAFLESKWIGHSSKVAKEHYLQVREEDFARATGRLRMGETVQSSDVEKRAVVQKAVPQASAGACSEEQEIDESPQFAGSVDSLQVPARSANAEERM